MSKKVNSAQEELEQLGVIFLNVSEKGTQYFGGEISGIRVVGFINKFVSKKGDNMTAINIYRATDAKGTKASPALKKDTLPF